MKRTVMIVWAILFSCAVFAAELPCELSVSTDDPALGEAFSLEMRFDGTQDVSIPDLSAIDGLQVQYRGPSTNVSIVNGKTSSSITHLFVAVPTKEGPVTVGPVRVQRGSDEYVSNAVTLQVKPKGTAATAEAAVGDGAFAKIKVPAATVYVGQHVPVTVFLLIRAGVDVRNVQMPSLSVKGLSLGAWSQPTQDRIQANGVVYTKVTFVVDAVAETSGEGAVGPVVIAAETAVQRASRSAPSGFGDLDSFFESAFVGFSTQPISITGAAVPLTVAELPVEGKPADFGGAIGDFTFGAALSKKSVSAGDTVSLVCEIKGDGAIERIKAPVLVLDKAAGKVYEPEIANEPGVRRFTFVIVPKKEGTLDLGQVAISFFDAKEGRYVTRTQGPFSLSVMPGEKSVAAAVLDADHASAQTTTARDESLGSGLAFIKEQPSPWRKRTDAAGLLHFWLWQLSFPCVCGLLALWVGHRRRLLSDSAYAKRFRAPAVAAAGLKRAHEAMQTGDVSAFYDAASQTLMTYISHQLQIPIGKAGKESLSMLRARGLDVRLIDEIGRLFDEADAVRYAAAAILPEQLRERMDVLKKAIAGIEKAGSSTKKPIVAALFLFACMVCSFSARADEAMFAQANAKYRAGDYGAAFSAYERIAETGSENGELWYDMGTCKAKEGKDIDALYYFEKALRYLPQDGDLLHNIDFVRARLLQTPTTFPVSWWRKPAEALPMSLLVCLALVFSAAAWIVVSCRWIFGVGVPGSVVGLVVGCALYVALCVTVRTDEASSRMMVVVPQTQARFEPDEKAAEYFVLAGGDIVAREKASGDWVRVRRNDGRPGWVSDGAVRKL